MFDRLFKALLVILPFHVLLSVFFQYKIWISWFSIYKEILISALFVMFLYWSYKDKITPKFEKIDYLIFLYFAYLILISLINFTSFKAIIYWARYDFEFLLVFLVVRHSWFLLKSKLSSYLRIFLISSSIAILLWLLVRFVFSEQILLHFWFSPKLSSWSFTQWIPIYHWVEWANVRRFQWIFDWPNQAAYFIIVYMGLIFHYLKQKKDYSLVLYSVLLISWWLIFLTYSRSSFLWIIWGLLLVFILNFRLIFKKYKVHLMAISVLMIMLWSIFYMRYSWNIEDIMLRAGSSKWHSERMIIGFNQFKAHPFGSWLSSSWPAYRFSHDIKWIDEKYFIPESWYVQQLVEWGFLWFILFGLILALLAYQIFFFSIPLFFSFIAILIMNVLLHTFEASYISIILFSFLGLFLKRKNDNNLSIKTNSNLNI